MLHDIVRFLIDFRFVLPYHPIFINVHFSICQNESLCTYMFKSAYVTKSRNFSSFLTPFYAPLLPFSLPLLKRGHPIFCLHLNSVQISIVHVFFSSGVGFTAIAAGGYHTCAVSSDGGLWCWGDNSYGQLGIGSTLQKDSPVAVSLGEGGQLRKVGDCSIVQRKAGDGSRV